MNEKSQETIDRMLRTVTPCDVYNIKVGKAREIASRLRQDLLTIRGAVIQAGNGSKLMVIDSLISELCTERSDKGDVLWQLHSKIYDLH